MMVCSWLVTLYNNTIKECLCTVTMLKVIPMYILDSVGANACSYVYPLALSMACQQVG